MVAKRRHKWTPQIGEKNYRSRLTDAQVIAIRADRRARKIIALDYGVGYGCIHSIQTGRNWRHI